MRCTTACMTDECNCRPVKVVQELREDETGKIGLRIVTERANWPGGIGEEPVFGEPV